MTNLELGIDLALTGRGALVTGAGAGIGREIARWLAKAGCCVGVNDIDAARADDTVSQLRAAGAEAISIVASVRDEMANAEA